MESADMNDRGRVLIITGDGKGKTTAALGMALRAVGHTMKVKIVQFIKSDSSTGEIAALQMLPGVEILQTGRGFIPPASSPAFGEHRRAAENGLKVAVEAIESGDYSMVIMDEVCVAIAKHLVNEDDVIETVKKAASDTTVVITGRSASEALMELADTVSHIENVKHGMKSGWPAQKGVEF